MPRIRELSASYHPSQHSHKGQGRRGCTLAQRKMEDSHCHPLLCNPSFKQGKFGFGSFFFTSFLGKWEVSNKPVCWWGTYSSLRSSTTPFAVFMASNLYIYIYTHIHRLWGFIYPFILKKSYKKYCLYNLKTLTIKLFILEQALRFVVSPAVRGPVSPKIQRGEMKLTALEAAVGDYLGTGAAILACCWGENCCFLPPFSLFSAELCWSQQHCIRGLDPH